MSTPTESNAASVKMTANTVNAPSTIAKLAPKALKAPPSSEKPSTSNPQHQAFEFVFNETRFRYSPYPEESYLELVPRVVESENSRSVSGTCEEQAATIDLLEDDTTSITIPDTLAEGEMGEPLLIRTGGYANESGRFTGLIDCFNPFSVTFLYQIQMRDGVPFQISPPSQREDLNAAVHLQVICPSPTVFEEVDKAGWGSLRDTDMDSEIKTLTPSVWTANGKQVGVLKLDAPLERKEEDPTQVFVLGKGDAMDVMEDGPLRSVQVLTAENRTVCISMGTPVEYGDALRSLGWTLDSDGSETVDEEWLGEPSLGELFQARLPDAELSLEVHGDEFALYPTADTSSQGLLDHGSVSGPKIDGGFVVESSHGGDADSDL